MRVLCTLTFVCLSIGLANARLAQPVFAGAEIFPPDEFAARRAKVITAIDDALKPQVKSTSATSGR